MYISNLKKGESTSMINRYYARLRTLSVITIDAPGTRAPGFCPNCAFLQTDGGNRGSTKIPEVPTT